LRAKLRKSHGGKGEGVMKIVLTDSARSLRHRSTDAERKLWSRLRDRRLMGFKFKRQAPRGRYVVDFLCVDAGVVVEVDGSQHGTHRSQADQRRTAELERSGLTVLRFWNNEVLTNLDGVLTLIAESLSQRSSPSPGAQSAPSSPQGERGAVPRAGSE
jgi:very-short-patch-repair endonuclease